MKGVPSNRLSQTGFRGRYDDGVESLQESDGGATWIAALNTDWGQMPDISFRMRILISHRNVPTVFNNFLNMQYSHNEAGYLPINDTSLVVRPVDTVHWVNNDNSTDFVGRLGTGNWDTTDNFGLIDDGASPLFHLFSPADIQTEMETEWCLQIRREDVSPGDTIDFRCFVDPTSLFTDGYIFTPRLKVLDPEGDSQLTGSLHVDPAVEGGRDVQPAQTLASKVIQQL